jgi:prophage maintenance system killer protein
LEQPFDLESQLDNIKQVAAGLKGIPSAYFGPTGAKIPDIAWYVLAAIKKTASLTHAFCILTRAKNTLAAASLIRLQLDTAMRIFGLSLIDDIEDAGTRLMNDESYRNLRSRNNEKLSDAVLHRELNKHYPGLTDVYEATSSYVHLSSAHIKTGLSERQGSRTLFFHLNGADDSNPDESFADIVDSFAQATSLTAELIEDFMRYRYARSFGPCLPAEAHASEDRRPPPA